MPSISNTPNKWNSLPVSRAFEKDETNSWNTTEEKKKKQQQKNERLWWTSLFRVCYCIKFRLAKEEKYLAEQQMQIVYITKLLAYTIQKKTNEE